MKARAGLLAALLVLVLGGEEPALRPDEAVIKADTVYAPGIVFEGSPLRPQERVEDLEACAARCAADDECSWFTHCGGQVGEPPRRLWAWGMDRSLQGRRRWRRPTAHRAGAPCMATCFCALCRMAASLTRPQTPRCPPTRASCWQQTARRCRPCKRAAWRPSSHQVR